MARRTSSTFTIKGWDETPFAEIDGGGKLTQASVDAEFSGGITGHANVQWLMCYRPDDTADFVGVERIVGAIGEWAGSFVLLCTDGTFDGIQARGAVTVAAGSATGELSGLRGHGVFTAPRGGEPSIELEYELD